MTDVFKLIEDHGLTLHGDIEHFAELVRAEAEKQEPYGYFRYDIKLDAWVQNKEGTQGVAFYTAPVHASDISQERVDETAKRKHEWVGLDDDIPGLGLVTEEFYNGMLCAEDILRRRNT
jgi:hypothetical protein